MQPVNVYTLAGESTFNSFHRPRLVTLVFAGYSVGGILVALTGKQLIESHGWQSVFYVAGLPVLLIPFILKTMPESMARAVALTGMGFTRSTGLLFVVVFIVGASTLGTQLIAYAYAGDFYPTSIRSTGVGFASGVGRIGAIVAPVLIGWLVSLALPLEQNFMVIALAGLIGALAVTFVNQARADSTQVIKSPALSR